MHELLLFAQITADDQEKVLHQLSGVTRMQPQHITERHLVFRAISPYGLNQIQVGASQGVVTQDLKKTQTMLSGGLYHIKAVGRYEIPASTPIVDHNSASESPINLNIPESLIPKWSIEFHDIPEAGGVQSVTSRTKSTIVVDDGDVVKFARAFGYEFHSQYVLDGFKFFEQDTALFLYRTLVVPSKMAEGVNSNLSSPLADELAPLDPQGSFLLEASITLLDSNNHELRSKATQQLNTLKETFRSEITLQPADRLALDTRVNTLKAA